MRNAEIPKQAHQQRLHFGVSQTGKSKIKGTLTFEVANPEILKQTRRRPVKFQNHDKIWTVGSIGHVAKDHHFADWKVKGTGFPNLSNSRYAKSRNNPSRWIKDKSGPSDPGGECGRPCQQGQVAAYVRKDTWHNHIRTSVKLIWHFRNLEITILSDTWQTHGSRHVIE
jgi:hypothetical protein